MARKNKQKPMKRRKISPETAYHDGSGDILQLPDHILQRLLYYMPLEGSVAISAVSKTWKKIYDSLPVLELSYDLDDEVDHGSGVIGIENFITKINKELSVLRSHRAIIKRFCLDMDYHPSIDQGMKLKSEFNDWLSLILRNYVEEICFRASNSHNNFFYTLPQSIFNSKTLVKLHLKGCKFPTTISLVDSNIHLKDISLVNIEASDKQIQELINICKDFLENLVIKTSPPVNVLTLYHFSSLYSLVLNVKKLLLFQAMKLDEVVLYGINRVYIRKAARIRILRCMKWDHEGFSMMQGIVSRLTFLETLQVSMLHNKIIRLHNQSLKTLMLNEGQGFEEPIRAYIEAPDLNTIQYKGFHIPFIVLFSHFQGIQCHHLGRPLHGSHLHMIGKFAPSLLQSMATLYLHEILLMENGENVVKTLEELRKARVFLQPSCVKMLVLDECIPVATNYETFLDALFWSCHPRTLAIKLTSKQALNSPSRSPFMSYLTNELVQKRETNPRCCGEYKNLGKCWRHYVVEVKFNVYRYSLLKHFGHEDNLEELVDLLPDDHHHQMPQNDDENDVIVIDDDDDSDDDDDDDSDDDDDYDDDDDDDEEDQGEEEEEEEEIVALFKFKWLPVLVPGSYYFGEA